MIILNTWMFITNQRRNVVILISSTEILYPDYTPGSVDADMSKASSLPWTSSQSSGGGDGLINKI